MKTILEWINDIWDRIQMEIDYRKRLKENDEDDPYTYE